MRRRKRKNGLLEGARVYLSGPMDFVASRAAEKQFGWRNRVGEFLQTMGVTVFDPWFKPDVRGLHEYGREDVKSGERIRERWNYTGGKGGAHHDRACAPSFPPAQFHRSRMRPPPLTSSTPDSCTPPTSALC